MSGQLEMKYAEFMRRVIGEFVTKPDQLEIEEKFFAHAYLVTVRSEINDMPKVIGGRAKMVLALTALLQAMAMTHKERATLEVFEPKPGPKEPELPFTPKPNWSKADDQKLVDVFVDIMAAMLRGQFRKTWIKKINDERSGVALFYQPLPDQDLQAAISTVFRAIGSARGRKLNIQHEGESNTGKTAPI